MKIIGFSDVITNSSSEVFTIYDESGIQKIKDIVNSVLQLAGSSKRFDDLFTIEFDFDTYIVDDYLSEHPEITDADSISDKDLYDFAIEHDASECDGYPMVTGITVKAKNPEDRELAKLLTNIDRIFESEVRYC